MPHGAGIPGNWGGGWWHMHASVQGGMPAYGTVQWIRGSLCAWPIIATVKGGESICMHVAPRSTAVGDGEKNEHSGEEATCLRAWPRGPQCSRRVLLDSVQPRGTWSAWMQPQLLRSWICYGALSSRGLGACLVLLKQVTAFWINCIFLSSVCSYTVLVDYKSPSWRL